MRRALFGVVLVGSLGATAVGCSSGPSAQAKSFCAGIEQVGTELPFASVGISTFSGDRAGLGDRGLDEASTDLFLALKGTDQTKKLAAVANVQLACSRLGL